MSIMRIPQLLALGVLLGTLSTLHATDANDSGKPATEPNDAKSIRAHYAKRACKKLVIAEPIEIKQVLYYKDGGSVGLIIIDAKKVEHKMAYGNAERSWKVPVGLALGDTYPGKTTREADDEEVSDVYCVLLRWVNRHPQRELFFDDSKELKEGEGPKLWEFRRFFLYLDSVRVPR